MSTDTTSTTPDYATAQDVAACQQLILNLQCELARASTMRLGLRIQRELTDAQAYLATLQPQS